MREFINDELVFRVTPVVGADKQGRITWVIQNINNGTIIAMNEQSAEVLKDYLTSSLQDGDMENTNGSSD